MNEMITVDAAHYRALLAELTFHRARRKAVIELMKKTEQEYTRLIKALETWDATRDPEELVRTLEEQP